MNPEPTNAEILKVITEGQKRTDGRIDAAQKHTDGRIDEILEVVNDFSSKMDKDLGTLKSDVGTLKSDVLAIKATIVDKDYLDRALAKQKGDIVFIIRNEDIKLQELVSILREKQVLTSGEAQHIMSMVPFPQLSV